MSTDIPDRPDERFAIIQNQVDWLRLPFWESIFSLSNGLLGSRGSFEEPMPGTRSKPMTFMAGLYNTLPKALPELPILPDWLSTRITLNSSAFDMRFGHTRSFTRWLDMQNGLLCRELEWEHPNGGATRLSFTRFLSLADRSLAVARVQIMPLDWAGPLQLDTGLAEPPLRPGPGRDSARAHWGQVKLETANGGTCCLRARTRQSRRPLAVAAAYQAATVGHTRAEQCATFNACAGQTYTFDRYVCFTAGAPGEKPPVRQAREAAATARREGFDTHLARHADACRRMWESIDIQIDGPAGDQQAVRFNLFQLATLAPQPGDVASIGPKGLSGTSYLGHIFWDTEIYMLPFFSLTDPQAARTLLMYRYHTLNGARRKAKTSNHRGAQYAWESADTGDEACPTHVPDPHTGALVRILCGEIQDHITADVPYAVDQYVRATGDREFLWDRGAEILFETARFWASRVSRNDQGTHDILDAMGPDEFHVHVDNDAFTNCMARWNLRAAASLYDSNAFPTERREAVIGRIGLDPAEPESWRAIAAGLTVLYDEQTGLIEQSEGFFHRPDLSPDILRLPRCRPITDLIGLDLAMEARVLKQAEVILMQFLLQDDFDRRCREVNFDYYEPRTSHDSSLSVSAHALVAARLDHMEQACDYFRRAARLDLDDLAGNTADGLHTANMGGVWLAIVFGFARLAIDGERPTATPNLPPGWQRLRFAVTHHGRRYTIDCTRNDAAIHPA